MTGFIFTLMGFGKGMSFEHGVSIGIYLFNFAFENLWG
jgi:hypothetical protein